MQPLEVIYDGTKAVYRVTPLNEYNFEQHFKDGVGPTLAKGRNSDVYWLAWECLRTAGVEVPPFGLEFLAKLEDADFLEEPQRPNG